MVFGERCRNVRADGRDQRVFLTHGQRYCAESSVGKRCPGFGVDEQQRFRQGWRWGVGLVIERGWCPRPELNISCRRYEPTPSEPGSMGGVPGGGASSIIPPTHCSVILLTPFDGVADSFPGKGPGRTLAAGYRADWPSPFV